MPAPLLTRIAPTPSGYLHVGNLANFLLIEKLARESSGKILLRIDDCDGTRARKEFVEHIFETLRWLGIVWHEGPRNTEEFYRSYSQVNRKAHYFEKLSELKSQTYACSCSRKEIGGVYAGTCREKNLKFVPGQTALRLRVEDPELARIFGDVVLWRKDDGPAYQWVSVVDDLEWGVNLIVRGEDLRDSSELQKYLAKQLAPQEFESVRFLHHPLVTDTEGKKLAKSDGSESVLELRRLGLSAQALREKLVPTVESWAGGLRGEPS